MGADARTSRAKYGIPSSFNTLVRRKSRKFKFLRRLTTQVEGRNPAAHMTKLQSLYARNRREGGRLTNIDRNLHFLHLVPSSLREKV
eukprot:CAMPEP_0184688326 /NCGR_PEP_ID=MMETSP0312-20130426/29446_1 /TAXON_ID=31354 /ORGANISM="Compsopogon coeruleus, Strain SAG 36.94" /LENGTH=86 /DNA_ID=CAMNT_0027145343 /DNA_START=279 /DNA_END=535 /DNA_ORIENTATION=+